MISYHNLRYFTITTLLGITCLILTKFTIFHVRLIMKNSTTIESLENSYNFRYSISGQRNFLQVFGNTWYLWPLPFYGKKGMPYGDGILWPMANSQQSDSDVNVESEANQRESTAKQMAVFNGGERWPPENKSLSPINEKCKNDSDTDTSFIRLNPSTTN